MERSLPRQYELRDAAKVLGVPGTRIKNWAAQGVISPSGGPLPTSSRPGTGGRRFFTTDDLVVIGLVDQCRLVFGDWIRPKVIARRIQDAVTEARIGDRTNPPENLVILLHSVPGRKGTARNVKAKILRLNRVGSLIGQLTRRYGRPPIYTILGLGAVLSQIRYRA